MSDRKRGEVVLVGPIVGDVTGERYEGRFAVKDRLSHADHLWQDRTRRLLLGDAPGQQSVRATMTAEMLAQLAVRVLESPSWWSSSQDQTGVAGMTLEDENLLAEVYSKCMAVDLQVKKRLADAAAAAREELSEEKK